MLYTPDWTIHELNKIFRPENS